MKLAHIRNPIAPALDSRIFEFDEAMPITQAIDTAGWHLPPSTFLLRRDVDPNIDWKTARPCDIFVKRSEWDLEPINDNDVLVLVSLPQNGGGGGSQILQIVAMLALVIAAWYAAGVWGAALANAIGTSVAVAQGVIASAIMIGGQILLSAILPHPKQPPNPKPTYSIGPQSNAARLGEAIPERFGRVCFAPDMRMQPYVEYQNNLNTVYELFCIGQGAYYVEEIRIGNNVIAQADIHGVLQPTGAYPEVTWQLCGPNTPMTLFPDNVVTSTEVSSIELIPTNQLNHNWTAWFVANPANTETTLIALDMALPMGLYSTGGQGKLGGATMRWQVQAQQIDDTGLPIGAPFTIYTGAYRLETNQPQRFTTKCNVPCGRYQVRAQRTCPAYPMLEPENTLIWAALRAYLPSQGQYGNCTMLAILATASFNLSQQSANQINVVATRILTTPVQVAGVWQWSATPQATRSIAAATYYLLTSSNCANLATSAFDDNWLLSYEALYQSRGDTFDGGFLSQITFWDMLNQVLNVGRAQAIAGPLITFDRDEQKAVYRCAFSPRSMLKDSFALNYLFFDPLTADAVTLTYLDERNWTTTQLFVALPGSTATVDTAPQQTVTTMVSRDQVWREWNYKLAASAYRRVFPSFQTELDGRVCYRGDLVKLTHILPSWGASADVLALTENAAGDILTLSEPWSLTASGQPMIEITTPDGYLAGPAQVAVLDDGSETQLCQVQLLQSCEATQGLFANKPPRNWGIWGLNASDARRDLQRERPKCLMGQGTATSIDALVVSMQPQAKLVTQVACVADDPRVYSADQAAVPPYITGTCDGGNANLTITGLFIQQSEGNYVDGKDVVLNVTVEGAPDAATFDYQFALNWGQWQGPFTGNARSFQFRTFAGFLQLQVRGDGTNVDGNWYEQDFNASGSGVIGQGLDFSQIGNSQYLPLLFDVWGLQ